MRIHREKSFLHTLKSIRPDGQMLFSATLVFLSLTGSSFPATILTSRLLEYQPNQILIDLSTNFIDEEK